MPFLAPYLMITALLAAMVAVKMLIAPWIFHSYGWFGVIVTIGAMFAIAKWLERSPDRF